MQSTATRDVTTKSSQRMLRTLTLIILLLLAAQFLVGMLVNWWCHLTIQAQVRPNTFRAW